MVLIVFVLGYYSQFYWLIVDPRGKDLPDVMGEPCSPGQCWTSSGRRRGSFAGLALLASSRTGSPTAGGPAGGEGGAAARIGRPAVLVAWGLLAIILPVMAAENIGLMAAKGPELPFRIAGWMVYSLRALSPASSSSPPPWASGSIDRTSCARR